ncbi:hypothetical protein HaLaN_24162, partial [Haematococcus lacustris]
MSERRSKGGSGRSRREGTSILRVASADSQLTIIVFRGCADAPQDTSKRGSRDERPSQQQSEEQDAKKTEERPRKRQAIVWDAEKLPHKERGNKAAPEQAAEAK